MAGIKSKFRDLLNLNSVNALKNIKRTANKLSTKSQIVLFQS